MRIEITLKITREYRGPFEALYKAHMTFDGETFFLGKLITNDEKTAVEYFKNGAEKLTGGIVAETIITK